MDFSRFNLIRTIKTTVLDDGTEICPHCETPSGRFMVSAGGDRCKCGFNWNRNPKGSTVERTGLYQYEAFVSGGEAA